MAAVVKVAEAKAHLSELLAKVERGEEFVIARGDRPIARLAPLDIERDTLVRKAIEDIRALRGRAKPVTVDEILAWKHEGHRY